MRGRNDKAVIVLEVEYMSPNVPVIALRDFYDPKLYMVPMSLTGERADFDEVPASTPAVEERRLRAKPTNNLNAQRPGYCW